MKDFFEIKDRPWLLESEYFFVIEDGYPVSPGHCLIISKSSAQTFFDLDDDEKRELNFIIDQTKAYIEERHEADGFNIGMNCGSAAGQTVMHFHCHLIPRYKGDMNDPRGGVRLYLPIGSKPYSR